MSIYVFPSTINAPTNTLGKSPCCYKQKVRSWIAESSFSRIFRFSLHNHVSPEVVKPKNLTNSRGESPVPHIIGTLDNIWIFISSMYVKTWWCFYLHWLYLFIYLNLFIYFILFLAVLGLRPCARALSSCGERGPLFIVLRGPLTIAASLVAEHGLQTRRLSSCGSRAQLLRGTWDLPRPGLKPVSPAPAGRPSTTAPPGKPLHWLYY